MQLNILYLGKDCKNVCYSPITDPIKERTTYIVLSVQHARNYNKWQISRQQETATFPSGLQPHNVSNAPPNLQLLLVNK